MRLDAKFFLAFLFTRYTSGESSSSAIGNSPDSSILSFEISPTAQLGVSSDAHRKLLEDFEDWEYKHGIYGALEYFESEDKSLKEEFDSTRHLSRYEQHLQNNRRSLQQTDYQLVPLFQGYGTHYATVWVGTPPQRKSVIVDTGSHYTAFPCVGCDNCGEEHHTDAYFDPSKSSTFHTLQCNECQATTCNSNRKCVFSQSYTEGSSWSAYQVSDRFFCGSNNYSNDPVDNSFAIPFMFGCQTSETGLFVTQLADGIMGISAHPATLPKKMYDARAIKHNMFTLCFKRELSVSKEGVTAGIMTLGGIDTRLNTSPMVYAKNIAESGWYTVNVKHIYLRKGGGSSAKPKSSNWKNDEIVHLPMDSKSVNSGKGVIVDSGTTDTYLSKSLQKAFYQNWKAMTGMTYSNSALKLTREEIKKLPTLLVQLEAFDGMGEKELLSMEQQAGTAVVGLVGSLDVTSPRDVLLAIPAEHFFEYSPSRDTYTSRLYFTETRGGVLGANAMQGHDVLFDWENGRIGFAESTCDYAEISPNIEPNAAGINQNLVNNDGQPPSGKPDEGIDIKLDCVLSQPSIDQTCEQSLENVNEQCIGKDPETQIFGAVQKSIFVVENTGSGQGKSCQDVAEEMVQGQGSITCSGEGMCTLIQNCDLKCKDIFGRDPKESSLNPQTNVIEMNKCMKNTWGACTLWCTQSRMHSVLKKDGSCSVSSKESRPCHIDACGSHDPCRVPFVVHVVIGLGGINPTSWAKKYEEVFVEAFATTLDGIGNIGPGDIEVLMTNPWTEGKSKDLGLKIIMEISIYTTIEPSKQEKVKNMAQAEMLADCREEDLYPFAKTALDVHTRLEHENFIPVLLNRLPRSQDDQEQTPFDLVTMPASIDLSRIITSWTIKTDNGSIHNHSFDSSLLSSSNFTKDKLKSYLTDVPFMSALLVVVLFICGMGIYIGYKLEARRDYAAMNGKGRRATNLMAKMRHRYKSSTTRGRYSKVRGSNDVDNGDIELA